MYDDPILEKSLSNLEKIHAFSYNGAMKDTRKISDINNQMCSSMIVTTDAEIFDSGNYACHAGLGYFANGGIKEKIHAVASSTHFVNAKRQTLYGEHVFSFLEWHMNFSPYADAFITKNVNDAKETGIVFLDANKPQNYVASAMQAMRAYTEHNFVAYLWYRLVDAGVHPSIAYPMGYYYNGTKDNLYKYDRYHCEWSYHYGDSSVIAFAKKQLSVKTASFKEKPHYAGSHTIWNKQNRLGIFLDDRVKKESILKGNKEEKEENKNPFAKAKVVYGLDEVIQGEIKDFVRRFKEQYEPLYLEKLND